MGNLSLNRVGLSSGAMAGATVLSFASAKHAKPVLANQFSAVQFGQADELVMARRELPSTIPTEVKKNLPKILDFLKQIDQKTGLSDTARYTANSLVNRVYQELYPRERGVIVYGSSRTKEGTPEFAYVEAVGAAIAKQQLKGHKGQHLFVVTGGGPGSMRAAAKGAIEAGGHAAGSAMHFIGETPATDVHPEYVIHPNFAERIDGLGGYEHRAAYTAVVPGGPGTEQEVWKKANELFFDQTLYPCQKQIVLYDYDNFFSAKGGFLDHLDYLVTRGKANPKMKDLFKLAKTPEEGAALLANSDIPWTPGQGEKLKS